MRVAGPLPKHSHLAPCCRASSYTGRAGPIAALTTTSDPRSGRGTHLPAPRSPVSLGPITSSEPAGPLGHGQRVPTGLYAP